MISSEERKVNLKRLISNTGKNVAEFCRENDLDPSYISQLLNGHRNIGEKAARKIEEKARLEIGILDKLETPLDNNVNLKEKINIEGRGIPVISWVSAGTFTTIDVVLKDTEIEEWLPPNKDCGKNGYGLIVTGVSMSPKFEPNDRIYVNPDYPVNDLKTGDLVVVGRLGETEATFKELIIEGQTKYLRPLNPNWGEQIIKLNGGDKLLGKVVGLYRKI